ncbi:UNKNOWN [Stylonychia lemnae]|uniref:Uncharacterized protein n=1 Tax=Stylonychia lemnae TaxID=5949 RepID=A0A078BA06_STYLE|nr:UNKNOWN [Stylonychia lemnae]|eukprot:CDW91066.1 UNKNOWN [Stylonychia lemnae]
MEFQLQQFQNSQSSSRVTNLEQFKTSIKPPSNIKNKIQRKELSQLKLLEEKLRETIGKDLEQYFEQNWEQLQESRNEQTNQTPINNTTTLKRMADDRTGSIVKFIQRKKQHNRNNEEREQSRPSQSEKDNARFISQNNDLTNMDIKKFEDTIFSLSSSNSISVTYPQTPYEQSFNPLLQANNKMNDKYQIKIHNSSQIGDRSLTRINNHNNYGVQIENNEKGKDLKTSKENFQSRLLLKIETLKLQKKSFLQLPLSQTPILSSQKSLTLKVDDTSLDSSPSSQENNFNNTNFQQSHKFKSNENLDMSQSNLNRNFGESFTAKHQKTDVNLKLQKIMMKQKIKSLTEKITNQKLNKNRLVLNNQIYKVVEKIRSQKDSGSTLQSTTHESQPPTPISNNKLPQINNSKNLSSTEIEQQWMTPNHSQTVKHLKAKSIGFDYRSPQADKMKNERQNQIDKSQQLPPVPFSTKRQNNQAAQKFRFKEKFEDDKYLEEKIQDPFNNSSTAIGYQRIINSRSKY